MDPGPTFPGGLPQPPPPAPSPQTDSILASLLPACRVILGALRPFPDAHRAVLQALNTLNFPGSLTGPEPVPLSP